MKKLVLFLAGLFFFGIFTIKAQEMTDREKSGYALGVMLVERLKSAEIDMSFLEAIRQGGFVEAFRTGFQDALSGNIKLTMEELQASLAAFMTKIEAMQNQGSNNETDRPKNTIEYQSILARNYCTISWYYLFIKEYAQSEQSALKALELDSTYIVSKTNLAHALLFQNRFSEAEVIYKELVQTDESYAKVLLDDFNDLEKAGVIPSERKADVEKIKQILQR